jgi:hypothetical protein
MTLVRGLDILTRMCAEPGSRLPKVVVSSVVRSTHQGESHGGVYLVDLETGETQQKLDWNDPSIDWEGRGGDRGLRGIAFHGELVYLAASDEIFVYDAHFKPVRSFSNRYLKHCHEIFVDGDSLFIVSTGYDSVLQFDIATGRFVRGLCLRLGEVGLAMRRVGLRPRPSFSVFDPNSDQGPAPGDTSHVNNVFVDGGVVYVSGTGLGNIWVIERDRLSRFARIPYGSHNARPFRGGVLLNHTATDRVAFLSRGGRVLRSFPLPRYDPSELVHASLTSDVARQAFGRGLTVAGEDLVIGGSSPATITAYRFEDAATLRSVNLTMDVRNAVHGLEIWPFD